MSNGLPLTHKSAGLNKIFCIVPIDGKKGAIVLDDDEVAKPSNSVAAVDNLPGCRRQHRNPLPTLDFEALVDVFPLGTESFEKLASERPQKTTFWDLGKARGGCSVLS